VDDSTLTGNASVKFFDEPEFRFSVALDHMDLDRYLPPPAEASEGSKPGLPGETNQTSAAEDDLGVPVDALRDLDLAGDLKADRLKVANVELSNVVATLEAKGGLVSIKPVRTALYQGGVDSGLIMDVRGSVPTFDVAAQLKAVQMGPLTAALQQGKGYLDGAGTFSANLQTRGERIADLKKRLDGKLSLSVTDGAIYDKELAAKVEAAVAFLEGRSPKPAGEAIIFESLTGSATVDDGIVNNRDLQFITSLILAKGEGTANLAKDTLDYTLSLALAGGSEDKKRVFVPITVKGPYADLKYGLNLEKVAKEELRREAGKRIDKELEKVLPEGLGAPLQEGLKGLLGQ
jgi:AsmA protein